MNCILCGVNHDVVTAPFVNDKSKWTIYRADFIEVTFEIKNGIILYSSEKLTKIEVDYIIKHILIQYERKM